MHTVKISFMDEARKCYTNVSDYSFENSFFVFTISSDESNFSKVFSSAVIKHIQIEPN